MSTQSDIHDFLRSRRARITPRQAGLTVFGTNRRVPGLRREEVAMLAGVSVDYYVRLERGNLAGVSDGVLESLCTALQLDDAERSHLYHLARSGTTEVRVRRQPVSRRVRSGVQRLLDAMVGAPAVVQNGRLDLLAANHLGRALYAPLSDGGRRPVNYARATFLDPRSHDFFGDWERAANDSVALLRLEAGRNPQDRELTSLIGELATRSETFRTRWAAHNVHLHTTGSKTFRHPVVGELTLAFEGLQLAADPHLTLFAYTAEPDSPSSDALALLASWSAGARADTSGDTAAGPASGTVGDDVGRAGPGSVPLPVRGSAPDGR
ncbi:helix-turn-helix transcriptional regulator [Arthrobacter agilis]|uniref:helix-turn-helix transcriptional regulator n=1 Tax=Arthrobacter agilis TaxID=37921 RepID=UPI0023657025|nr:helix-turn-helix transcriptional regulator [Arthrobacter agilis]WDF33028.1 helix-turn-helix transcriptional regulator [Arthrobacter agilis]